MRVIPYNELKPLKGIPYSRDHLRRKCAAHEFPQPIRFSESRIGWLEHELDEWIEQQVAKRDSKDAALDPLLEGKAASQARRGQS